MIERFFLERQEDRLRWEQFRSDHPLVEYRDHFVMQLREFFEISYPHFEPRHPATEELFQAFARLYRGVSTEESCGVWIFYPWRQLAVRLLPPAEFHRVRSARNRNLISESAQETFRAFRLGIVGLSIGNAIARTLALQGGAENFSLADPDTLALSNLNRIQGSVLDLGENKTDMTARQIWEIAPYADLTLFPQGLTVDTVERFLAPGGQPLDAVVDAVDSFEMKWVLREHARRLGIPVLMATCIGEKVLLDVERYDQDRSRKLFVRDVPDDFLARVRAPLDRRAWVAVASLIVGEDELDDGVRATNAAIGTSVTTRPLLGSTVVAMSVHVARAVRLLALGEPLADGRHRYFSSAEKEEEHVEKPVLLSGQALALSLFATAASRVPAYETFLRTHGVDPATVRTIEDFHARVPEMDKDSYLRVHSLKDLSLDGDLGTTPMFSVSSGSTGKPMYWPRGEDLQAEGVAIHSAIFRESFRAHERSTLVLVCFSMGQWIAGTYTAECVRALAKPPFRVHLVTPGIDVQDAVAILADLGGSFEQIVIAGYPPIVKDILDATDAAGVHFPPDTFRFLFAGEGFSEQWRTAILARTGAVDVTRAAVSVYGTADAGVMGYETPASVAIRRWCHAHPDAALELFQDERLPTIVQVPAHYKYVEQNKEGELLFTCRAGIPLIRYNLHDVGGVLSCVALSERLAALGGADLAKQLMQGDAAASFVYVFGRKQSATTIYAVNIYLENIQAALAASAVQPYVSGKAVMSNGNDADWNQYWAVVVELAAGVVVTDTLHTAVAAALQTTLLAQNSEYRRLHATIGERAEPRVTLLLHGVAQFRFKTKLRWAGAASSSQTPPGDDVASDVAR